MGKQYCVFWFPSIYHTFINERLQRFEVERIISDFGLEGAKLIVSIDYPHDKKNQEEDLQKARKDTSLIKHNLLFKVVKTNSGTKIFNDFELSYVDHTNNGMVVYLFEKPENYPDEEGIPSFEKALTTIFYHCAKSLFHNHEVQTDRDSGLVAYIPNSQFNTNTVHDKDNEAIKFFFEQYEKIFMDYAERASTNIAKRDAILAKFEGKINLSENDFNLSGYKSLIQHGRKDFKQWFQDDSHLSDVWQCKKDIGLWHLIINPKHKKRKKKREHYIDRHNKIASVLISKLKETPTDALVKTNYRRYKEIGDKLKEWGSVSWDSLTKKDVFPIDSMLNICEIELEINESTQSCGSLYRKLKRCYLDLPILTERTRRIIGMLCEGAMTEYVYCKTLLESKYNTQVTHDKFDEEGKSKDEISELDKWRKKACNIRNAIRYIETVKYRCGNAQTNGVNMILKKADKLSQQASVWTIVGIILSVIGVALTTVGTILAIKADATKQECSCSKPLSRECVNQLLFR